MNSIDRYLDGDMSPDELKKTGKEISEDENLQHDLKLHKEMNKLIADKERQNFHAALENAEKQYFENDRKVIRLNSRFVPVMKYAAIIILFLGITIVLFNNLNKPDATELYCLYFKPYDASSVFRSEQPSLEQLLSAAFDRYNTHNYSEAIALFTKYLERDSTFTSAYLYMGISYMELNKFDKAEECYKTVLADKGSLFGEHAMWYLGLLYLKENKIELAKQQFEIIRKHKTYNYKSAEEILSNID